MRDSGRRQELAGCEVAEGRIGGSFPVDGRRPDVIVGGGVTGGSIAYRLSQRGRRVLLLERRAIASGASGRDAGNTGAGSALISTEEQAVSGLATANLAMLRGWPRNCGSPSTFGCPAGSTWQ
jgi:hypothetical protein